MSLALHKIVVQEAHLKGSYTFYEWVKKHVGNQAITLVTETGLIYKQNARPDGREQIQYLIGRTFSIYKMPLHGQQTVNTKKLHPKYAYDVRAAKAPFVLCVSKNKACTLENKQLGLIDTFTLPLEWREHFGLYPNAQETHQGDLTKSVVQKVTLHASLYKIHGKLGFGEEILLGRGSNKNAQILTKGWVYTSSDIGAWSTGTKAQLKLPHIKQKKGEHYTVTLNYFIFNASKEYPKNMKLFLNGQLIKNIDTIQSKNETITLNIPDTFIAKNPKNILIDIETSKDMNPDSTLHYGVYIKSIAIGKSLPKNDLSH